MKILKVVTFITVLIFANFVIAYGDLNVIGLAGGIFRITSGGSDQNKAFVSGMLTCSEITKEHGYRYFYIVDYQGNVSTSSRYIPQIQTTIKSLSGNTEYKCGSTGYYRQYHKYETIFWIQPVDGYIKELGNNIYDADIVQKNSLANLKAIEKSEKAGSTRKGIFVGISVIVLIIITAICVNKINEIGNTETNY